MRFLICLLATAGVFMGLQGIALADSSLEPGASPPVSIEPGIGEIVIGVIERRILGDYYQRQLEDWEHKNGGKKHAKKDKGKDFPPGLAKKGELPPGLQKQLVRNGRLPPGLQQRDLPPDLLARLPRLNPAYRYTIVDNKVMLIQAATNIILDLLTVAAVDLID